MVYHFIQSIYNCSRALLIHLFFAQMKRAYSGQELFLLHFELMQFRLFLCALCRGIRVRSCIVNEYNALSFIIFHCITFGDISNKTRGKTISHWTIFRIVRQIQIVRVFVWSKEFDKWNCVRLAFSFFFRCWFHVSLRFFNPRFIRCLQSKDWII